jgi:hypothetical protein
MLAGLQSKHPTKINLRKSTAIFLMNEFISQPNFTFFG